MSQHHAPTIAKLRQRLAQAEAALAALRQGQADTLIGEAGPLLVQLKSAVEERERAQREAERLAKEWETTFDAVPDAIWILDAEQRVVRSNRAAETIFGCARAAMIGKHCWEIVHGTGEPIPECPMLRMRRSRRREQMDMPQNGRWFHVTVDPILDAAGQLTGAVHTVSDITERKRLEEGLRRERTLLERITTASPVGIVVVNRHGQITFANPQAEQTLAVSREAMTRRTYNDPAWRITDLAGGPFPDDELPFRRVLATGQSVTNVCHAIEWPDSRRVLLSINGAPLLDAAGAVESAVFTVSDITERLQGEAALRESERRLATLMANLPGMAYRCQNRPDWPMDFVSEGSLALTGWPADALQQNRPAYGELIVNEDRQPVWDAVQRAVAARQPFELTYRIRTAAGQLRWVWERGRGVFAPDGTLLCLEGFVSDITARQQAEEAQSRLATAVEQAAEAIVITDASGAILYVNPAFEKVTGYPRQEVLGQNPRLLKSGRQDAQFYQRMWATLTAGQVWRGHFVNKRKDGQLYEDESTISPLFDAAGRIVNYVAVKRDISRERALEAQLRQSQKMEALGTLASGVAHEINNPITGILNYAQLIQDRLPADSPLTEFTGEIMRETERVAGIVRDLLIFARNEKQRHHPAHIADIVEGTLSLIRTVIRRDQITLTVHVPEDLPQLKCRSQQLQQVLMNLMTNARDALNERYPGHDLDKVLHVSARQFEKEGRRWIRVTVEDHGTGIPPEVRERMFDPFFTTKPRDKGTGLGLAISHGIVKEHHGEISVESEPGRFTRVHVDLPVVAETT